MVAHLLWIEHGEWLFAKSPGLKKNAQVKNSLGVKLKTRIKTETLRQSPMTRKKRR